MNIRVAMARKCRGICLPIAAPISQLANCKPSSSMKLLSSTTRPERIVITTSKTVLLTHGAGTLFDKLQTAAWAGAEI